MRACLLLLLLTGCQAERPTTATVAPAEPQPAKTATAAMNDRVIITTSGSPTPPNALAPGTQQVTISRTGISMRELLPVGHTVFHIRNETAVAHDLVLRSRTGRAASAALPAGGRSILQARLTDDAYALVCATPGHAERTEFSTYIPGPAPLR